jgi:hypothetical protein
VHVLVVHSDDDRRIKTLFGNVETVALAEPSRL